MRRMIDFLTLCAALLCTPAVVSAQAHEMEGEYVSTNLDGSPIAPGYTIYIDVTYQNTDENGIEHYVTQSRIVDDDTGQVVKTGNPGSLEWDSATGFGDLTGSTGIEGYIWEDMPGSGTFIADYSNSGGNTRLWTRY